jgi:hypothetical protein
MSIKTRFLCSFIIFASSPAFARGPSDPFPAGTTLVPCDNVWRVPVDSAVISSSNTNWMDPNNGRTGHNFHANFGSAFLASGSTVTYNGLVYNLVWSSSTPRKGVLLSSVDSYAAQSDTPPIGGVPIPDDAIIQCDEVGGGGVNASACDQHLLIVDLSSGMVYEMWQATRTTPGGTTWTATNLAIWFTTSSVLRPDTWTSADAAGLPITEGTLRWEEVDPICNIKHAIRFELGLTKFNSHIWPARHDTSSGGVNNDPFGMRVRMKAGVDLSVLSDTHSICIFNAVKKYGLILADNGGDWYIDGAPNPNWNDTTLHNDFINVGLPENTMEVVDAQAWAVDPVNLATVLSTASVCSNSLSPPVASETLRGSITESGAIIHR